MICFIAGNNTGYSIVNGNGNGNNSRRQSNIPRFGDNESTCSLQGCMQRDYSPKSIPRNRAIERLPLYLNGEEFQSALEQPDSLNSTSCSGGGGAENAMSTNKDQLECAQKKPLAKVRPRQILSSIKSSLDDYQSFHGCIDFERSRSISGLRESLSLDPFPNQLRRRLDYRKLAKLKLRNRSVCSLDAGVAIISSDPRYREDIIDRSRNRLTNNEFIYQRAICNTALTDTKTREQLSKNNLFTICTTNKTNISAKHLNNNCNGSIGIEDPNCPLLHRQGSLNSPHDEILLHHKRWRSLETVGGLVDTDAMNIDHDAGGGGGGGGDKKVLTRNSIRSWLFGLFHGNGFRSNDASLRKVGVGIMQAGGVRGFTELPSAPEHESIV